ncbi:D-glucuronyl C5-epimerase B-like [Stegodyphus dumicola]|uniref:D-glucuronyl C5-epimerase B-like n=1 Tax=Stegodyphus dumicola TaxID=202533 RepID=UPI0015A8E546|nr:D-glucuronyl C5-epimerase B-like [Stegodyphus dumicola]XP_035230886.1 D-glucuronyl C5-epimerase B-like [Stegodyphus dumicola]XP_035230887.1 D-glucuronyl C5-epimerase B-like [Stegodyphus dumicola]XP_035230888.1 D-glucuronyl C5-epimerase B-like [Stegodyphus dumicola]
MNSFSSFIFNAGVSLLPNSINSKSDSPMRVRISLKLLLVVFTIVVIVTSLSYWTNCGTTLSISEKQWRIIEPCQHFSSQMKKPELLNADLFRLDENNSDDNLLDVGQHVDLRNELRTLEEIECSINDEYTISCRQDNGEVFIPFSFIQKYFEVYGKIVKHNGVNRFDWQHSYSKVYFPKQKYDPSKVFLWFENYNVEVRDRVKCISGIEGVPVSTQWDTRGHFYPIQIAQFGLSHFSKNLTEGSPTVVLIHDGETTFLGKWLHSEQSSHKMIFDSVAGSNVLEFKTSGNSKEILSIEESLEETTLNCDLRLISNASLTVVLGSASDNTLYRIHYIMSDVLLSVIDSDIYYGIGNSVMWKTLTRDLLIDLSKGLPSMQNRRKISKSRNVQVRSIILSGFGRVDNISLSSTSHMAHFFAAANWLVNRQDENGGWPNMVTRKLSNGMLELAPGWYSAMAQGQAMSVLTRAFRVTGDLHYLEAALRAIKLFNIRSEQKGILTTFLGKYVWYEEYPTIPSSYVLNGFIYSLFGLYDVQQSGSHKLCREAGKLFDNGLISLKQMLPLFDTGSGSVYDLRHFSLGVAPNLARWDYHSTHINQLLFLSTIHDDPILKSVSERWTGYMKGKKSPHN